MNLPITEILSRPSLHPPPPRARHGAWYPDHRQELSVELSALILPYVTEPHSFIQR